jgi:anthranilate synthase/aminodeoxychorismate synthase-like glutamine amidotransferase
VILLLDNFDSFVHTLARYFVQLGEETRVVRSSSVTVEEIQALRPRALVLSPGPRDPTWAGVCLEATRRLAGVIPILGVCLGHQVIGAAFGGRVERGEPVHGRESPIHHNGRSVFRGLPSPFLAARYHSLVVSRESLPPTLEVTAWTEDGVVMALEHVEYPVVGIQFHPESILTEHGYEILAHFLDMTRT